MKRVLTGGVILLVAAIVAALLWLNFGRTEGPDEFSLSDSESNETAISSESNNNNVPSPLESLDGSWTVAEGSEAGYRVLEDLRGVQDFEVVGRTTEVTGSMDISGNTLEATTIEIDVASITTDSDNRDDAFRRASVMDTETHPTATFTLTESADLGEIPTSGETVNVSVTGDLTLKGVTEPVTFDVEAQISDTQIEAVGGIDVAFASFGIENPSNAVAQVRDEATVEFRLLLNPSA